MPIHTRKVTLSVEQGQLYSVRLDEMDVNTLARERVALSWLWLKRLDESKNAKTTRAASLAEKDCAEWRRELDAMDAIGVLLCGGKPAWEARLDLLNDLHKEAAEAEQAKKKGAK